MPDVGLFETIVGFLILISVLVFVHEWGHFIVARLFNTKVDVFSIGFGREIVGFCPVGLEARRRARYDLERPPHIQLAGPRVRPSHDDQQVPASRNGVGRDDQSRYECSR